LGTLEQRRPVDLAVVHEHVRVDIGCRREVPLPHLGSDLGPTHALMVEQADPAMSEIVGAEHRHRRVPAGAGDRHAQTVGRPNRDQRRVGVTILAGGETIDDDGEQVGGQLDPSRSSRLGDRSSDEPRLPVLVEVAQLRSHRRAPRSSRVRAGRSGKAG
jgi:hypothetical protein